MVTIRAAMAVVLSLVLLPFLPAGAQEADQPAKEKKDELRLRGRGIFRYEIRDQDKFGGWSDEIELDRARFEACWDPTKRLRLLLEIELTEGVEIRDAFARYKFHRAFRAKAGNFKKPFSPLRMSSSWDLLIPRRGLIDDLAVGGSLFGGYGGRDAGLTLFGRVGKRESFRFHYWLGVFDGWRLSDAFFRDPDDPNDENTSHRDYLARVQADIVDHVSVGASYNHKRARLALAPGAELDRTFNAVEGDVSLRLAGFGLQLEGIYGTNPSAAHGHKLLGGHGIVSYRIELSESMLLTPTFMIEFFDPDDEVGGKHALRLAGALNLDIGKHTRVVLAAEGGSGELVWTEPEFITWDEPASVESSPRRVDTRIILQLNVRH